LKKAGFEERRQRGSHLFLWHPEREAVATVPMQRAHAARNLPRGTLKAIIRQAGLTEDEFQAFI